MIGQFPIEQRLVNRAIRGKKSVRLRLWPAQAKRLKSEGFDLLDPKPTDRKGLVSYEISFENPRAGSYAERLKFEADRF